MKTTTFVLFSLFVGTLASPTISGILRTATAEQAATNERIVTGQILEALENIAQQIRDAGLDPWNVSTTVEYELPVSVLFSAEAMVEDFVFKGLSNIVVQSMNFSILQTRLTFNIVLPRLSLDLGVVAADATVFGERYGATATGTLNINVIRVIGDVRLNVGIISGISVRSLSLNFSIASIESALNIGAFGLDMSPWINNLLGSAIPSKLNEYSREVNQLLEIIARQAINDALDRSLF